MQFDYSYLGSCEDILLPHRFLRSLLLPESYVPSHDTSPMIHFWKGNQYEAIEVQAVDQYQLMVEDFADALINSRPPKFDPQDAVNNMRVIDMLLASARGA